VKVPAPEEHHADQAAGGIRARGDRQSVLLDNRLQLNVNAFYSRYADLQRSVIRFAPDTPTQQETFTSNAAGADVRGIELETQAFLARAALRRFDASLTWNDPQDRYRVSLWGKNLTDNVERLSRTEVASLRLAPAEPDALGCMPGGRRRWAPERPRGCGAPTRH